MVRKLLSEEALKTLTLCKSGKVLKEENFLLHTRRRAAKARDDSAKHHIDVIYESIDQPKVALSINQIPLSWKTSKLCYVPFFRCNMP